MLNPPVNKKQKMNYKLRDIVDVQNRFGTQRYLITSTASTGIITMQKVMLGKTKISAIRFPETITIVLVGNAAPEPRANDAQTKTQKSGKPTR